LLVELAQQGDTEAFGELVRRHHKNCVGLATIVLRNRWDAEDEVQNALLKAHTHLHQFKGQSAFSTWLFRIVVNQCLMFMRRRQCDRSGQIGNTFGEKRCRALQLPTCDADPEGEFALSEIKQRLRTAIRDAPPTSRTVIILRYMEDLPITDVAETLRISVPAAKSRLMRARTELRVALGQASETLGNVLPLTRTAAPLNRLVHGRGLRSCSIIAY
jgi:RNA polymerase sigma-70 factor (ECF subfamily)